MPGIPFFEPPFRAVELHCQLCNVKVEQKQYVTERVRAVMDQDEGGDYLFCQHCAPIAAEVGQLVQNFRATARAATERDIDAKLPELVAGWVAERVSPQRARGEIPGTAPAPEPRKPGRRPRGMIADPNANGA